MENCLRERGELYTRRTIYFKGYFSNLSSDTSPKCEQGVQDAFGHMSSPNKKLTQVLRYSGTRGLGDSATRVGGCAREQQGVKGDRRGAWGSERVE